MTGADPTTGRARVPAALAALAAVLVTLAGCGGGITPITTAFNKGVYQYSQGNYPLAVREYREALADDPDDHRARFNLALTLETLALERRRALPGRPEAERAAAEAEVRSLEDEARGHYEAILAARPGDLRASVNLAAMEYEAGEREEAKARLRALIEARPHAPLPRTALAAHLLREAEEAPEAPVRVRLRDEAEVLLREATAVNDASLEAHAMLGEALSAQGAWEGARQAYTRALEREPSDFVAMMGLARNEVAAGEPEAAIPWLQRVLFLDRDAWEANLLLGRILAERGDAEEAVTHLWAARRLDGLRPRGHPRPDYEALLEPLYRSLR